MKTNKYIQHFNRNYQLYNERQWVSSSTLIEAFKTLVADTTSLGKVLDVGIGTAVFPYKLGIRDDQLYGVDINENMLNRARELFPHARLTLGPAEHLQYDDEFFDLVYERNVLKHAERPSVMAQEMVRVCRTGQRIVLVESIAQSEAERNFLNGIISIVEPTQGGFMSTMDLKALVSNQHCYIESEIVLKIRRKFVSDYLEKLVIDKETFNRAIYFMREAPLEVRKILNILEADQEIDFDYFWGLVVAVKR